MNFDALVGALGGQPFFDLSTVAQLADGNRASLRTQLGRWERAGKVLPLRRGMYTLAERYRRAPLDAAALANHLRRPSYLTGLWALSFHGFIPEQTVVYTSVTTRGPCRFENAVGVFEYRHVKQVAFFGYRSQTLQGATVLLAEPEKALLDLWYLSPGEWTEARLYELRVQHAELLDVPRLSRFAAAFQSPRLARAVAVWMRMDHGEGPGTVLL